MRVSNARSKQTEPNSCLTRPVPPLRTRKSLSLARCSRPRMRCLDEIRGQNPIEYDPIQEFEACASLWFSLCWRNSGCLICFQQLRGSILRSTSISRVIFFPWLWWYRELMSCRINSSLNSKSRSSTGNSVASMSRISN